MVVNLSAVARPLTGRFFHSVLTLWLVTVLFFLVIEVMPYDFATASATQSTVTSIQEARYKLGLHLSAPERYIQWLGNLMRGDLGTSWWADRPIKPLIAERLWHSAWLFGWATAITVPFSLALAFMATVWRRGFFDRASSMATLTAMSLPDFVVAYGLMFLLAVHFDVFPAHTIYALDMSLTDRLHASALPILSLAAVTITPMFRLSRAALDNILSHEYIEMAELKGLRRWRIIYRHALPNAVGPIANAVALALANLFFGLVIIEVIYSYPGLGSLLVIAAKLQDIPLAQACGLISAVIYIGFNFIADSISLLANPRLRYPTTPLVARAFKIPWFSKAIFNTPRSLAHAALLIVTVVAGATVAWRLLIDDEVIIATTPAPSSDMRDFITVAALQSDRPDLTDTRHYDYFKPMGGAQAAKHQLQGILSVPRFKAHWRQAGQNVSSGKISFPGFETQLISHGNVLLPVERDRLLKLDNGNWYIILSPGRVWHEPTDGDFSRGSFPFTLTNPSGFGQHYGVATFVFNDHAMSQLRVQVAQETANWAQYDIWGQTEVTYLPGPVNGAQHEREAYTRKLATQLTVRPWSELQAKHWRSLEIFDGEGNRENISVSGLMIDDVFYLRPCRTRAGPHPYCREMRYDIFSISKSMGAAVSMLWLAHKYGPDVFDEKITDYVSIPADHDGWDDVTFGNTLDMTTGIGNVRPTRVNFYVEADSSGIGGRVWRAPSIRGKLDAMAEFKNYPWGPGEVTRYRSSDTTALAAAMEAYLRKRQGSQADLWQAVSKDVFAPLGIDRLPVKRTSEPDGRPGTPMLAAGMYVTFEEALKIARLFQDHGQYQGKQLLHRELTQRAVSTELQRGFPTGWRPKEGGEGNYEMSFWLTHHKTGWFGCTLRIPTMAGYGGNYVNIMPNRTIGLRFADGHDADPATWDSYGIRSISDRIRSFCQ